MQLAILLLTVQALVLATGDPAPEVLVPEPELMKDASEPELMKDQFLNKDAPEPELMKDQFRFKNLIKDQLLNKDAPEPEIANDQFLWDSAPAPASEDYMHDQCPPAPYMHD